MLLTILSPQIAPFFRYFNVLSDALQLERAQTQLPIATLDTREKLARVNSPKDVWDCCKGQGKKQPITNWHVPGNDPRKSCGTHTFRLHFPCNSLSGEFPKREFKL